MGQIEGVGSGEDDGSSPVEWGFLSSAVMSLLGGRVVKTAGEDEAPSAPLLPQVKLSSVTTMWGSD